MLSKLIQSINSRNSQNAFCIEGNFYSYRQLKEKVNGIVTLLKEGTHLSRKRVAIYVTNSFETYASVIACWVSGAAYIPIHPKVPDDRNLQIIQKSRSDVFLTNTEDISLMAKIPTEVLLTANICGGFEEICIEQDEEDRLLYILFTSGSTGEPKGVPISLKNLKAFVKSFDDLKFEISERDRFLQMFDLTFDVSVASFLIPLLNGACTYTVSSEGIKYFEVLRVLQKEKITFATIVPSVLTYLKKFFNEIYLPDIKYCILTAEASSKEIITEWMRTIPNAAIVNLYGPTEATIWCTSYFVDRTNIKSYNDMIVIGRPFSQVDILIVDEENEIVNKGEKGILCVNSVQLTTGYLNDIQKTNAVFFDYNGTRYYKTGDLCYIDGDQDIVYCGRSDYQVKIQGFRIELSEIEFVCKHETGLANVAVAYKNEHGVLEIVLFTEFSENGNVEIIKQKLNNKLPYYMIPAKIYLIREWPVNRSGKIDRIKLLEIIKNGE